MICEMDEPSRVFIMTKVNGNAFGGKIYNDLPIEIRREGDYDKFLKLLKD